MLWATGLTFYDSDPRPKVLNVTVTGHFNTDITIDSITPTSRPIVRCTEPLGVHRVTVPTSHGRGNIQFHDVPNSAVKRFLDPSWKTSCKDFSGHRLVVIVEEHLNKHEHPCQAGFSIIDILTDPRPLRAMSTCAVLGLLSKVLP